jgi:outer membrane protein OmpA-like peptidoglycan-associated protein
LRRLLSLVLSIGALASGLGVALTSPVSAASGDVTITRSTTVAPAAVPNAQILRLIRLEKENAFLAIGRDANTEGSTLHVWKIKGDLSIDTSFPAVNLGDKFAEPTSTNSNCTGSCSNTSLNVNEAVGTYVVTFERFNMTGTSQFSSANIRSFAVGSIKTGAVSAQTATVLQANANFDITPFAQFATTRIARDACVAGSGATNQGFDLSDAWFDSSTVYVRPDNSLIFTIRCTYNNNASMVNANWVEYTTIVAFAMKPQGGDLVFDSSFGNNGHVVIFNDPTKCASVVSASSYDTTVPSLTSQKLSHIRLIREYARVTTVPSYMQGNNVTSYNGCYQDHMTVYTQTIAQSFLINGALKSTVTLGSGGLAIGRYVIDSAGKWSGISSSFSGATATYKMLRLLTNGEPDTTNGTNGVKDLSGLPSTITVDGASVRMNYNLSGIALTANSTLFAGFSGSSTSSSCDRNPQNNTGTISRSTYPYYFDDVNGLLKSYGTDGLGDAFTFTENKADSCSGRFVSSATFIDSKGRPSMLSALPEIGAQKAGLTLAVWDAAEGVIGGGEGAGELAAGGGGRIDTKVYTKLPAKTEVYTAFLGLSGKQVRTLKLSSTTKNTCVVVGRHVALVAAGSCEVQVQSKATGATIRTLRTTVVEATAKTQATSTAEAGTTMVASDPILFKKSSANITKTARGQIRELKDSASDAAGVVVIGHAATLTDASNFSLSRNRAQNVSAMMQRLKVRKPIAVVAKGKSEPLSTKKTEKAQAQNRRVVVYLIPSS